MKCSKCSALCSKWGKSAVKQRFRCRTCGATQYDRYRYKACGVGTNLEISRLLKESCGIRSISRLMQISAVTVLRRIVKIAKKIEKPFVAPGKIYEADELKRYVSHKSNEQWVIYALDRSTKKVVDFRIGRRTKSNIASVVETLLLADARRVYTDGLNIYKTLIPRNLHVLGHITSITSSATILICVLILKDYPVRRFAILKV